jgi:hypothetical protein
MLGLNRLWTAITRLAAAVEGLSGTVEAINSGVRAQLGLADAPPRLPVEVAAAPATAENGRARPRSDRQQAKGS